MGSIWTDASGWPLMVAASALGACSMPASHPTVLSAPLVPAAARPVPAAVPGAMPPGMQFLYGSGEATALSVQAWRALVGYVAGRARARPADSVVLVDGATLATPRFVPCGTKPFAVVFDVDETVLLNLGFEADDAAHPGRGYDAARWRRWEATGADAVVPTPGAAEALAALRAMGVTVVFNTNRSAENAAGTQATIEGAGLGPARHGDTLYLSGDDATGARKDGRRGAIAARFCVLAMGGDQLGDFSDLFNAGLVPAARRAATIAPEVARLWGVGWFVLPNPVYGTALAGTADEVFPAGRRWADPGPRP